VVLISRAESEALIITGTHLDGYCCDDMDVGRQLPPEVVLSSSPKLASLAIPAIRSCGPISQIDSTGATLAGDPRARCVTVIYMGAAERVDHRTTCLLPVLVVNAFVYYQSGRPGEFQEAARVFSRVEAVSRGSS